MTSSVSNGDIPGVDADAQMTRVQMQNELMKKHALPFSGIIGRGMSMREIINSEKLTEEQIKEYNDAFQMFDKDGNGFITTGELKSLMRCLGCNPTDSEVQQIINEVDADGNGKVDLPEFIQLMEKMTNSTEEHASTMEAFRVFDGDGRGYIPTKLLREVIMKSLDQVSMHEVNDLLKISGLSDDRNLSYDEFAKLVMPKAMLDMEKKKLNFQNNIQQSFESESS